MVLIISKSSNLINEFLLFVVLDDVVVDVNECRCCKIDTDEAEDLFAVTPALEVELAKLLLFELHPTEFVTLPFPEPDAAVDDELVERADSLRETNEIELAGDKDTEFLLFARTCAFSGDVECCRLKLGPSS